MLQPAENELQQPLPVPAIITSCRDCIFAQWDGEVQTGCEFDRLQRFAEQGGEVIRKDSDQGTYYIILGRFCNACRNYQWGTHHPANRWKEITTKEFAVRVSMLIYVDNSTSLFEVERTLRSIVNGTKPPRTVVILLNNAQYELRVYMSLVRELCLAIPWEVRDIQPDEESTMPDYDRAIDIGVQHCKSTYYAVCKAGYEFFSKYLSTIEYAINDRLMRFVALLPDDDGNGLFVQTAMHNFIRGNSGESIIAKLRYIAQEENTEHMIKTFEELPSCESA